MSKKRERRRPVEGTLADRVLEALEERYPGSFPTGELTVLIFKKDTLENRQRLYRALRTLRKYGYNAHGLGRGRIALCDRQPEKLKIVVGRNSRIAFGIMGGFRTTLTALEEAQAEKEAQAIRRFLKRFLVALARTL
ncbi:hypothetical protein [Desulfovirgula thermocuniculi]|uniref:hypothetical protein n=1 Tax=Desulfovirgula thermocuniculi TaxID=348842 RepID=UPI00042A7BED|nr:hypothetical protein [Desulfovirgula thermocuniculi]